MSLLNTLMSKIFGHSAGTAAEPAPANGLTAASPIAAAPTAADMAATAVAAAGAIPAPVPMPPPAQPIDVAATLDGLAAKNPEKLDWKHSIVDLLKLVGMESDHAARKELAHDLHYRGDMNDSAAMNLWLHKEVMQQLAAKGGKVPNHLLDQ